MLTTISLHSMEERYITQDQLLCYLTKWLTGTQGMSAQYPKPKHVNSTKVNTNYLK